eukprot:862008-Alexandrium_andersonii.AAC.1
MSASLVGSEMCIRDSCRPGPAKEVVTLPRRPAPPLAVEIPRPAGVANGDNYHFHEAAEPGAGQV